MFQPLLCCFVVFISVGFFIIPQLHSALTLNNKERQIENEIEVSWFQTETEQIKLFFSIVCHLQQRKHLLHVVFHSSCILRIMSVNLKCGRKQPDKQILKTSSKSSKSRVLQHQSADTWAPLVSQHCWALNLHKNNLICNYFILLNHRILNGHDRKQPPHSGNYSAESVDLVILFAFHVLAHVLKIFQQLSSN